jgi:hypothetical protein
MRGVTDADVQGHRLTYQGIAIRINDDELAAPQRRDSTLDSENTDRWPGAGCRHCIFGSAVLQPLNKRLTQRQPSNISQ